MQNTVDLDIFNLLSFLYKKMEESYDYAFVDQKLSESRTSYSLSYISVLAGDTKLVLSHFKTNNTFDKIYLNQSYENLDILINDKDWAYPNNVLSHSRALSSLNSIFTSIKQFKNSTQLIV